MNFLELCQRLRQEAGASGVGPSGVTGQRGEDASFVAWIQQAWREIQVSRDRWHFAWAEGEVSVAAGDRAFSAPADMQVWDEATVTFNGKPMNVLPWTEFRKWFAADSGHDHPSVITQKPDGTLMMDAAYSQAGTLAFEYWRTPQALVAETDTPRLPERYHMTIVYRALLYYALYESAPEMLEAARSGEARIFEDLARSQLPPIEEAETLA